MAYVGYQLLVFWLPRLPYENLGLNRLIASERGSQKFSFATFHPKEKEGKVAYLLSSLNLEEPSRLMLNSTRYLPSQS